MFKLGFSELVVIFLAVIVLFGAKGLPEIARGLGSAIRNFRKAMNEVTSDKEEKSSHPLESAKMKEISRDDQADKIIQDGKEV